MAGSFALGGEGIPQGLKPPFFGPRRPRATALDYLEAKAKTNNCNDKNNSRSLRDDKQKNKQLQLLRRGVGSAPEVRVRPGR
jgi:hypothetical protein